MFFCVLLWETLVLLNISGGWHRGFPCKENFLSLPIWIRIKAHFKRPFTLFKSLTELWMPRTIANREVSLAKVWFLRISHLVSDLRRTRVIMDLVLNLEELLHLAHSKKMFACSELHFVSYFSKNQLKVSISFLIFHLEIVWNELRHATLYQMLLRYLERHSSLQDPHLIIQTFCVW